MKCKEAIKSSEYDRAINLVHKDQKIILRYDQDGRDDRKTLVYDKSNEAIKTIEISKWKLNQCNRWVPDNLPNFPSYIPRKQYYRHILAQYKQLIKEING